MTNKPIYRKVSDKFNYKNMGNFNPFKPFILWANTNSMLDDYYAQPNINLGTTDKDNNIRNTMRHIVGPALMTLEYNPTYTRTYGLFKEARDFIFDKNLRDAFVDFKNNDIGMNYAIKNPNATNKKIFDFAFEQANKNYNLDYPVRTLYGHITNTDKK